MKKNKVEWLQLLGIRQTWTFVVGKLLTDPIWYFFLFWLPSYFSTTFHIDLTKPSLPLVGSLHRNNFWKHWRRATVVLAY